MALLCSQGTYVLQDNSFPLLVPMASGLQYVEEAPKVRGAGSVPFGSHLPGPPQGRPLPRFRGWDLGAGFPSSHSALCPPPQFLAFTCGLLCGTLHTLGFQSLVTASVTALPACESLAGGGVFLCLECWFQGVTGPAPIWMPGRRPQAAEPTGQMWELRPRVYITFSGHTASMGPSLLPALGQP
jgi:hypothetical protein